MVESESMSAMPSPAGLFLRIFTGPALFKRYRTHEVPSRVYVPNFFESKADSVLWAFSALKTFAMVLSPILIPYMYRRGFFTAEFSLRFGLFFGCIYAGAITIRGFGRIFNDDYRLFLRVLEDARKNSTPATLRSLREFDFEFWAWPVNYNWSSTTPDGQPVKAHTFIEPQLSFSDAESGLAWRSIKSLLSWFAANTFGGWLLYPGRLAIYNILLGSFLLDGRSKLVEEKKGRRSKLRTRSGIQIDCMFVDRRNDPKYPEGNTLVVTSEGNAGYYELGCMVTPLEKGYSVLGWNHPGFAGSTGLPWPGNEGEAIATVLQFARTQLAFQHSDTILFAWSIGGFSASWAAMNHPDVKGVVVDATFDDLLPLALAKMPQSWASLVEETIRNYWDLPILRQLEKYPGPIQIVRRTKDEIICTEEKNLESQRRTNRARHLLQGLLSHRYPRLVNQLNLAALESFLDSYSVEDRRSLLNKYDVNEKEWREYMEVEVGSKGSEFPSEVGEKLEEGRARQLFLFLAHHYLTDFDSPHCNPLPASHFPPPRHPWQP